MFLYDQFNYAFLCSNTHPMSNVLHSCQEYFERTFLKVCQLNRYGYITANGVVHTL